MEEHWFLLIDGEKVMEITRDDVKLLNLVPCGGFDSGNVHETYFVHRGHPAGDDDWQLPRKYLDGEIPF